MKFNKILALSIALMTFVQVTPKVYAAEKSKPNCIVSEYNNTINDNTVITEKNMQKVLKYFSLGKNSFIKSNDVKNVKNVYTVGELKQSIKDASKNIKQNSRPATKAKNISKLDLFRKPNMFTSIRGNKPRGAIHLSNSSSVSGSYSITVSASGQYYGDEWCGVSDPQVSVSSDVLIFAYKIGDNPKLKATWTPSCITVKSSFNVETYVGVANKGLVRIKTTPVTETDYFDAEKWID